MNKLNSFVLNHRIIFYAILIAFPIVISLICIGQGRYQHMSFLDSFVSLFKIIFNGKDSVSEEVFAVLINIRIPRILLALIVGAGLSVAGASFQALFNNYLATPDTLGVASGASFGAVVALLLGFSSFLVQGFALLFGLLAVFLAYLISIKKGHSNIIMIILAGIIISSMFTSFVSLGKYVADPEEQLPTITFWLMGSFANAQYATILFGSIFIILGIIVIFMLRWKLNILLLNENDAHALGMNIKKMRMTIIVMATLITASAVSMTGQVGWIGLLIPHMTRMIVGNDNKFIIPTSISLGASFMVLIDTLSRTMTVNEIPISILTASIGAPIFIFLLRKTGGFSNGV